MRLYLGILILLVGCKSVDHQQSDFTKQISFGGDSLACSALQLSADILLTSAHCIPENSRLRLSVNGRNQSFKKVVVHPDWDSDVVSNDIAIIFLSTPSTTWNVDIYAGALSSQDKLESVVIEGRNQKVKVHQFEFIDEEKLILSDIGSGVCKGNSGSPVYIERDNLFQVVGIISGITKERNNCNDGGYTVIADLKFFIPWLESEINKQLGE